MIFLQRDDGNVGYRGMDEDAILNREGLTPQQYLEFTERFVTENDTALNTVSTSNNILL